ncbi:MULTISPECIES: MarR family winged helix-turn-helix transcriptional regulator [unclassified Pseudoclavibacter]|uniref:MarR family winged helix-turn-helix transcriptional regulator n=1 Tax=unclassified Pseudoclavibacter TaxID=2615177 RepID=UPI0012EF014A|nr:MULTISPECIES: helix-turn-helix domain-containing protein [unclassified Pseudoclavibacter]MBF4459238.1 MarR family transcriptional regulator [Pseudoclavibacter sp. VKM Ac-2867]VXC37759.1 MarR family transcriptional regulator [Pseudoclavibacter sp. 8L]
MPNIPSADREGQDDDPTPAPPTEQSPALLLSTVLTEYADARSASQNDARRSLGIGEMDARALAYLKENPGARPSALRAHLGLTSAGVSTLCDRLIERGTIHRDTDPSDRRASLLTVMVDLAAEPWNRLGEFDRGIASAIAAEAEPETLLRLAQLLTHALRVSSASRADAAPHPS